MKTMVCHFCKQEFEAPVKTFQWICCTNCEIPNSDNIEKNDFEVIVSNKPFSYEIFLGNQVHGKEVKFTCLGGIGFHAASCTQTIGWFVKDNGEGCWAYDGIGFLSALSNTGSLTSKSLKSKEGGDIVDAEQWSFRIHRMVQVNAISCFGTFPFFEGMKTPNYLITGFTPNQEFVLVFVKNKTSIIYFKGPVSFKNEVGQLIQPFNEIING